MATPKVKKPPRIDWETLVRAAKVARRQAYAPYSKFKVGAAVLGTSGRVYLGCNVENVSYGLTVCAERNAISTAVLAGERHLLAVAIAGPGAPCAPCGACRQVMAEFAGPEMPVVLIGARGREVHPFGDLLPFAFEKRDLDDA